MYFSCTITSLFVWEGKAKEKSLFSFSFLFCFLSATYFVLWRPVLMYVRSLLFDNKPDFYFVSCTSVSLLVLFVFFFLLLSGRHHEELSGGGELAGVSISFPGLRSAQLERK